MATLQEVANRAQDLYYQDYASNDDFFDVADFKYHCAVIYSKLFNEIFQMFRKEGKMTDGFSNVEISAAWLIKETVDLVEDPISGTWTATLNNNIFGFGFDEFSYALDIVKLIGDCQSKKCKLQKISRMDMVYLDIAPTTGICYYWLDQANQISFTDNIGKVLVPYVPAVDANKNNCVLSDFIVSDVIKATLTLMFGAKNGNVVDEVNDANKNAVIGQQVNPQLSKIQQQQ